MAMMNALPEASVIASVCPLCRRANGCAMAGSDEGGDAASPCWCVAAAIDPATLARASALDGGRACVCAACAAATP
jgi:hypothetical protein